MIRFIHPFIILLLSIWLINLGAGLQSTLLGMRGEQEGFDITAIGFIMSSYYVGYILSFFFCPPLINSVGHIRAFSAFASLASAATLLHAVFVDPSLWFVMRILTGVCFGGLILVGESWLNVASSNENRGSIFAIYMVTVLGASALSQVLINLSAISGYDLFVLVSIVLSLSLVPLALGKKIAAPEIQEVSRMRFRKLMENSPLGTVGVLSAGLVSGALWTMMAVFSLRIGLDKTEVSQVMFFMVVGGMLSLWPVGYISDRMDRRKIIFSLALAGLFCSLLFFLPNLQQKELLPFLAGALGFVTFPVYAVSSSHINDYLEQDEFVAACGSMVLLFGLGALISPVLVSSLMGKVGPFGMFWFLSAIHIPLILLSIVRIYKKAPLPIDEQSDFVFDMPKVTPTVSPLDPRNQEAEEISEEIREQENLGEKLA